MDVSIWRDRIVKAGEALGDALHRGAGVLFPPNASSSLLSPDVPVS